MFKNAIVRTPGKSLVKGLSSAGLGLPDYQRALKQHAEYITALEDCGLEVLVLPPLEEFPDSTFVEDVALIAGNLAIITRPGAPTRRGETEFIERILADRFDQVQRIQEPGTVEGGDILKVESQFFIGLSSRTNHAGAKQLIGILEGQGLSGAVIELREMLHLKSGLAYLGNSQLLACGELLTKNKFQNFELLAVDPGESYASNCIQVNGSVILPKGFPKTRRLIQNAGYPVIELEVTEFQKLDGGLSCLSLRY